MTTPTERRRAATAASEGESTARNVSNTAANTAANAGASAILAGLPGPLSGAATALSEGIAAAIKASTTQARPVPGTAPPLADPTKLFAAQLALAIITALWCFIKSILNPLPIIGVFFPLCSEEDRARSLPTAPTSVTEDQQPSEVITENTAQTSNTASTGISFEQFLASRPSVSDQFAAPPRQTPSTTNNVQQQLTSPTTQRLLGVVQADDASQPVPSTEQAGASDIRKLFGL